jgi:hypothetical protein
VDLHALLDDWGVLVGYCAGGVGGEGHLPSKGFMRASLAMVAQAPLVAAARGWWRPAWLPPIKCLTAS